MIENMDYAELLKLRMDLNNAINEIERVATIALNAGEECAGFELQAGRSTRFIKHKTEFTAVLREEFADNYSAMCTETKELPLTRIEKLIKQHFDKEDAQRVIDSLQPTLDLKVGEPKLVYVGEE